MICFYDKSERLRVWLPVAFYCWVWITLLRIINQYHRIRYIAKYHNASFYPCNGPLGKEQPEQPEQNAGTYQCEQVEVCNSAKMEGSDTGAAPQYKEDIEEITADYISDSHFRILFQCGDDGSGKLRQGSSSGYQR